MRLAHELRAGTSFDDAIADRRRALHDLLKPFDAVHILGHVAMSESHMDPETYQESEHRGLAYIVELVAAELVSRSDRAGTSEFTPAMDRTISGQVHSVAQEAVQLETFRRFDRAGGLASPEAAARGRAATQHLMLRGPGWPWQEHRVLRGLFSQPRIAKRLRASLGFDAEIAIACAETISKSVPARIDSHGRAALEHVDQFGPGNDAYEWATHSVGGWQAAPGPDAFKARVLTTLWAMNHIGEALVIDAQYLVSQAEVTQEAADAYLQALSTPFGQNNRDWFGLAECVRYRPYLSLGNGQYMPTVPGNDLWTLRSIFEAKLQDSESYRAHRGRWLESTAVEAVELLSNVVDDMA